MRVGDIASGRSGDKGSTLDLTIVARDAAAYELLAAELTPPAVASSLQAPHVDRYELPELTALKFVIPGVLGGGTYASMRAGMHWQKAAISALLDVELRGRPNGLPRFCVRPPGWVGADAADAFAEMRAWAVRAEELGFDGLFVGDRLLAQATGPAGPVYAASMLEATTVLAALAAVTERILLGPLVMVLPYRHPVQLAKTIATLDLIAGGRLVLGAGLGWNASEFEALQIPRSERAQRLEEALSIVRRLWSGETVSHAGTWSFEDVKIDPLPAQDGNGTIIGVWSLSKHKWDRHLIARLSASRTATDGERQPAGAPRPEGLGCARRSPAPPDPRRRAPRRRAAPTGARARRAERHEPDRRA